MLAEYDQPIMGVSHERLQTNSANVFTLMPAGSRSMRDCDRTQPNNVPIGCCDSGLGVARKAGRGDHDRGVMSGIERLAKADRAPLFYLGCGHVGKFALIRSRNPIPFCEITGFAK